MTPTVAGEKLRLLDLFSGIGGFSLAAEWAGIETAAFCERDKFCKKILAKHWPGVPIVDDIHDLRGDEFGTIDVISGGFPCQPFSLAGKRAGAEDDRFLWPEMLRVIQGARASWVLGENVPGIVGLALDGVLSDLEGIGYETQTFIIPACAVDAPHRRDRVWIVAHAENGRVRRRSAQREAGQPSRSGQALADSDFERKLQPKGIKCEERRRACNDGKNVSNTIGVNDDRSGHGTGAVLGERSTPSEIQECEIMANAQRLGRYGGANDEAGRVLPGRDAFARCREAGTTWEPEPCVGRVAHGVSGRVDRLKSLGNSIVPEVAFQFFKMIQQIERGKP